MCKFLLGESVPAPNRKCKIFVGLLIAMLCIEILIAIGAFVVVDIPNGIFAVLFVILLFPSIRFLQYTTLMMYMICCIVVYVMALVYVLGKVQNGDNLCPDLKECARFILNIAFFVFYFIASFLTFFIYREFKAVAFEKNPELARFFPPATSNRKAVPNISENNLHTLGNFAPTYGLAGARQQPRPSPQLFAINPSADQPSAAPNHTFQQQNTFHQPNLSERPSTHRPNYTQQSGQVSSGRNFKLPWVTPNSQNEMKSDSQKSNHQATIVQGQQKSFKPFKGKGVTLG